MIIASSGPDSIGKRREAPTAIMADYKSMVWDGMAQLDTQDRRTEFSQLIVATGRRDTAAFSALFAYFAPRIKAMMMRRGFADQRAEDVAQDTMLLVWRKAGLFDPAGDGPATWIYTIARNVRIDSLRRDQRARRLESEILRQPDGPQVPTDVRLIGAEAEDLARAGLNLLSVEQKTVVIMSFFEDKAHAEIAAVLGIPLGTVKSRLRLAMKRLRSLLEEPQ